MLNLVPIKDLSGFVGKEIYFRYHGWDEPVRSKVLQGNVPFISYRGEHKTTGIIGLESGSYHAIYLEEPHDGCSWCSGIQNNLDCCFTLALNKGR